MKMVENEKERFQRDGSLDAQKTKSSNEKDENAELIQKYNLFARQEDVLPAGIYPAKFLCMSEIKAWENNAVFYFLIEHRERKYVAGFLSPTTKVPQNSLLWHLWLILTGKPAYGHITAEDLSHYHGFRLRTKIIPTPARRIQKFYPRVIGVFPFKKQEAMK